MKELFLMGNQAIAMGALDAGVGLVAGYPGTPSTEVLETVAKENPGDCYVEWSINEKAAMEVAAGAAYAGIRSMVTMKQVGLNVALDPLMSLAYLGVKAGMVLLVADDPGPISSQTEQDTRRMADFARIPVLDPASPEEAYAMTMEAFALSERLGEPVILRPTTRVCHGCANVAVQECRPAPRQGSFTREDRRIVFPRTSFLNHQRLEKMLPELGRELSDSRYNTFVGQGKKAVAVGGVTYAYLQEALALEELDCPILRVGVPHPFPDELACRVMDQCDTILALEELSPYLEDQLNRVAGVHHKNVQVLGKHTGHVPTAGELSVEILRPILRQYLGKATAVDEKPETFDLPVRPPVLCAGCPHRASFYAVKKAMKGQKAVFTGDIGCYTLGNAQPLDMVDTCLCMGAGITIAQGLRRAQPDAKYFAFVGDSTFFASGMTGVANAIYNQTPLVLVVLDNSTTAMTGHQPHPGLGKTMMGVSHTPISIEKVLNAMGVASVEVVDPLQHQEAVAAVKRAAAVEGVSAIIFRSPCAVLVKKKPAMKVDGCVGCLHCVKELGCPALVRKGPKVEIVPDACNGCGLCAQICPAKAITEVKA